MDNFRYFEWLSTTELFAWLMWTGGVLFGLGIGSGTPRAVGARLAHLPMLGTRIGTFELIRKIGHGGMGVVYEAKHLQLGFCVAVKLLVRGPSEPGAVERALAEAKALCAVEHPGIVRVSDFGQLPDGTLFLIMEYLKGESLHDRERLSQGPQPILVALGLARQIAAALKAVHGRGIVHRDLKPANLILIPDPELAEQPEQVRVKVIDFGIAYFMGRSDGSAPPIGFAGTPGYMSPEQCAARREVGPASDVYSLGIILFELLTGTQPYDMGDGSTQATLRAHRQERARPLRALRPEVPLDVDLLMETMLAKRPELRPPMAEVADRLQAAQQALAAPPAAATTSASAPGAQTVTRPATPELSSRQRDKLLPWFPAPLRSSLTRRRLALGLSALALLAALLLRRGRALDDCFGVSPLPGMACISGGTFEMGSSLDEIEAAYKDCQNYSSHCSKESYLREQPIRRVTLSAFLLGKYEVTNEEFANWLNHPSQQLQVRDGRWVEDRQALIVDLASSQSGLIYRDGRFAVPPGAARKPVIFVTWKGANDYCQVRGWELPTEAQWEWAARGAGLSQGPYPWGSTAPTCEGVVFMTGPAGSCKSRPAEPAPVGSARQDVSPQGIFDLGGNVEEWVKDRFKAPYPNCHDCRNPIAGGNEASGASEVFAARGGSWAEVPSASRAAARTRSRGDLVDAARGFRCAAPL